jgi:hypothetical protein
MSKGNLGTIGQLLCAPTTQVNFARLVNDLGNVLGRFGDAAPLVTWDCDDIAIFDMPGTRILLGWGDDLGPERLGCLTVAVGPSHLPAVSGQPLGYEQICVRLIGRVQAKLQPMAVFWHQMAGIITAADIDALIEALPMNVVAMPKAGAEPAEDDEAEAVTLQATGTGDDTARPVAASGLAGAAEMSGAEATAPLTPAPAEEPAAAPAGPLPPRGESAAAKAARASARVVRLRRAAAAPSGPTDAVQPWRDPELAALRDLLLAEEPKPAPAPARPSAQMRLAVHAMNATLIVVYAPFGAAVMTYSLLKGEDMRLTARVLTLAGSVGLLLKSPLGHSLMTLAGA